MGTIYTTIPDHISDKIEREIPKGFKSTFIARAIASFFESEEGRKYVQMLNEVKQDDARTA